VERKVREWRGARRARSVEAAARRFFFSRLAVASRRCWRKAMVKTEVFFHLLVSLLANPSRLGGGCEGAQGRLRPQICPIVFSPSRHPVFADEPSLVPRQMLLALIPDPLRWSVCDPHAPRPRASRLVHPTT